MLSAFLGTVRRTETYVDIACIINIMQYMFYIVDTVTVNQRVRVQVNGIGRRVGRDRVRVSNQDLAVRGYAASRCVFSISLSTA
jgi:hypothetical protein